MKSLKFFLSAFLLTVSAAVTAQNPFIKDDKPSSNGGSTLVKNCDNYNRVYFGYAPTTFSIDVKGADNYTMQGFNFGWTGGFNVTGKKSPLFLEVGANIKYNTRKEDLTDGSGMAGLAGMAGLLGGLGGYSDLWDMLDTDDYDDLYSEFFGGDYDDLGSVDAYTRTNMLTISVPVSISYKLSFNNGVYLAPYAGVHFNLHMLANSKTTVDGKSSGKTLSMFDKKDMGSKDATWNRFQMGYQVGANIGYNAFNFGVGYSGEFSEISKKVSTGGVVVNLGYNF